MGKHWTIKDTTKMKGRTPWNKGKKTGIIPRSAFKEGHKAPKTAFKKGQEAWNKGMKRYWASPTEFKKGDNLGEKNHNWKGGITPEHNRIRSSEESKLWIKAIFQRDNFTCQKTGQRGGRLTAHHINNFAQFPEIRFAIDNGITLSVEAHKEFHKKYGIKNNTKQQLIEFISN